MLDDLNPGAVAADPSVATDPGSEGASGGGETGGSGEGQGAQAQGDSASAQGQPLLGPKELPPELEEARKNLLKDYHAKTQGLAKQRKDFEGEHSRLKGYEQDARALAELMGQEWFKKAMDTEKKRRAGSASVSNLSDDEFQAIKDDKHAFGNLVDQRVEAILESKLGSSVQDLGKSLKKLQEDREFERVAGKYKDFDSLHDKGLLGAYFERGYGPEDAYIRYHWDNGRVRPNGESLEQEVEKLLAAKKAGSVEKPGPASVGNAAKVIKAKNFSDAFDRVFAAIQAGEHDVRVEKAE